MSVLTCQYVLNSQAAKKAEDNNFNRSILPCASHYSMLFLKFWLIPKEVSGVFWYLMPRVSSFDPGQ
jgi:hypothetical protein